MINMNEELKSNFLEGMSRAATAMNDKSISQMKSELIQFIVHPANHIAQAN